VLTSFIQSQRVLQTVQRLIAIAKRNGDFAIVWNPTPASWHAQCAGVECQKLARTARRFFKIAAMPLEDERHQQGIVVDSSFRA
jgi:hypothetical protein